MEANKIIYGTNSVGYTHIFPPATCYFRLKFISPPPLLIQDTLLFTHQQRLPRDVHETRANIWWWAWVWQEHCVQTSDQFEFCIPLLRIFDEIYLLTRSAVIEFDKQYTILPVAPRRLPGWLLGDAKKRGCLFCDDDEYLCCTVFRE